MDDLWFERMVEDQGVVGLIAGNGPLPVLFAREAAARGLKVVAVAHLGETLPELNEVAGLIQWIRVGELRKLVEILKDSGVRCAVLLGGIDKKRALRELCLDEWALRVIQRLQARGDDTLLGALAEELGSHGIRVLSSQQLLAPWLAPEGVLTGEAPTEQQASDVRIGIQALGALGALDIGQTVVVKEGVILAVEAIEGTDQAIRRAGALGGSGAVVVKGSKPGQDMRFDVPVAGMETIATMAEVGAQVLALEAQRTLLLDPPGVIGLARQKGIVLMGWVAGGSHERY
jgi:DUF1009 family protein